MCARGRATPRCPPCYAATWPCACCDVEVLGSLAWTPTLLPALATPIYLPWATALVRQRFARVPGMAAAVWSCLDDVHLPAVFAFRMTICLAFQLCYALALTNSASSLPMQPARLGASMRRSSQTGIRFLLQPLAPLSPPIVQRFGRPGTKVRLASQQQVLLRTST